MSSAKWSREPGSRQRGSDRRGSQVAPARKGSFGARFVARCSLRRRAGSGLGGRGSRGLATGNVGAAAHRRAGRGDVRVRLAGSSEVGRIVAPRAERREQYRARGGDGAGDPQGIPGTGQSAATRSVVGSRGSGRPGRSRTAWRWASGPRGTHDPGGRVVDATRGSRPHAVDAARRGPHSCGPRTISHGVGGAGEAVRVDGGTDLAGARGDSRNRRSPQGLGRTHGSVCARKNDGDRTLAGRG